jgi:hypothetical protein
MRQQIHSELSSRFGLASKNVAQSFIRLLQVNNNVKGTDIIVSKYVTTFCFEQFKQMNNTE